MTDVTNSSRLKGFRDRSPVERRAIAARQVGLADGTLDAMAPANGLTVAQADHMIENAVGVLGTPVGVATNFTINGSDVLVPMATEEPSVVAAASNAARIARATGGFHTSSSGPVMEAQIHVLEVPDPHGARLRILHAGQELVETANAQDPTLTSIGGGASGITARVVECRSRTHLVVHLAVDVRDAMGANTVNTMAEALAPRIGALSGGRPLLRILTNKSDQRLARARVTLDAEAVGGRQIVRDIVAAAEFAEADPYRAVTHNKGIMNGVTAVALATGNDTRAIEAGAHSHAIRTDGGYTALSHFEENAEGHLVGSLEMPLAVGLVGGATKVNPAAQAAIDLLGVRSASALAEVMVAVGLAQNAAALRALATEGIQRGHMALHARNVAAAAGAADVEVAEVADQLVADGRVDDDSARQVLAQLRSSTG